MKLSEIKIVALTYKDIERYLDNQPEDELYTIKEISIKLNLSVSSLGRRFSNISEKYRYCATENERYYGCPKAIEALKEHWRKVIEG